MAVASVRKNKVIGGGVSQQQAREKPCTAQLPAHCSSCSPNAEDRPHQKKRVAEVPGGAAVGWFGNSIPVVEKSSQAHDGELFGMLANPFEGDSLTLGFIFQLAQALKFFEFQLVEIRLQVGHEHAFRPLRVAQAELQAEIVANKNKASKDFIVSNEPRRKHKKENC